MTHTVTTGLLTYSETGNTALIGRILAEELSAGAVLSLRDGEPELPAAIGHWFVGMPIHGNKVPDRVREALSAGFLAGRRVSFFYTHTGLLEDDTTLRFEEDLRELATRLSLNVIGPFWHCRGENRRPDVREWVRIHMPERYPAVLSASGLPTRDDGLAAAAWARGVLS